MRAGSCRRRVWHDVDRSRAAVPAPAAADSQGTTVSVAKQRLNVRAGRKAVVVGRTQPGRRAQLQIRRDDHWFTIDGARAGAGGRFALRDRRRAPMSVPVRVARRAASTAALGRLNVYRTAYASWYGPGLYGGHLACGGTLYAGGLGVAHKTLPCGAEGDAASQRPQGARPGDRPRALRGRPRVRPHRGDRPEARLPRARRDPDDALAAPPDARRPVRPRAYILAGEPEARDRPPRLRRVLRDGRAAAAARAEGQARDRRRLGPAGGGHHRELRGAQVRGRVGDARLAGAPAVPGRDRHPARLHRLPGDLEGGLEPGRGAPGPAAAGRASTRRTPSSPASPSRCACCASWSRSSRRRAGCRSRSASGRRAWSPSAAATSASPPGSSPWAARRRASASRPRPPAGSRASARRRPSAWRSSATARSASSSAPTRASSPPASARARPASSSRAPSSATTRRWRPSGASRSPSPARRRSTPTSRSWSSSRR